MNTSVSIALAFLSVCWVAMTARGAEAVPYGVPDKGWNERWGNHRARVRVETKGDAVRVRLPWRRRDGATDKAVIVVDAAANKPVANVARIEINAEFGEIAFEAARAGEYHVYFMPFAVRGHHFPTTVYDKPQSKAAHPWLKRHALTKDQLASGKWRTLPKAKVIEFQARREFHRRDPMELVATAAEMKTLLAAHADQPYLLFCEDRRHPIRMTDRLPARWITRGPAGEFRGEARRNEFYVFQIGLFAASKSLADVAVEFSDLRSAGGKAIPATALRCFNTGGTDWLGRPMRKQVDVAKGKVQALWCGVDVPADAAEGTYKGAVTVRPRGEAAQKVALALTVETKALADRGDSELWRLSRLRWLDSRAGLEPKVTVPYTPLETDGATVKCLGRSLTFGRGGLPAGIRAGDNELLAAAAAFIVKTASGDAVTWRGDEAKIVEKGPAAVTWSAASTGGGMSLACQATMEFDGYVNYRLTLKAERAVDLADCRLVLPLKPRFAKYLMGMGRKGGYRGDELNWRWDQAKHQDSVWTGNVDGGLQCKLKGPNYRWPLVNIHYRHRPLLMPEAWDNGGKGGCRIASDGADRVTLAAFGGPRRLAAGAQLHFHFALLITPVKPLNTKAHWQHRYYHGGVPTARQVADAGAKIINIHHGNDLNPFINYPFLTPGKMATYIDAAHERKLKVKLYYTIRELTNHVAEFWALRSLNHEIFADGRGGGYAWLMEHVVDGYSPAWHHRFGDGTWCASISQTGLSRWHNYYIEGLGYLARNLAIDGLYLDEIGYDREIMKRVRRVLDANRKGALLDLHSWNHLNGRAGYANCLNLYLEHLPYIDSIWIGEGRNYNEAPDHWMVEIAGIPFGVMGEMLQGGGNPWRGMLYGMTSRLPWSGDPRGLWKLWDDFGIQDAEMLGYWSPACPVKTGRRNVLATVYRKKGSALVVVASWAPKPVDCTLKIDFKALGLDATRTSLRAPTIAKLQAEALFKPDQPLPVKPGGGWMLLLEDTPKK